MQRLNIKVKMWQTMLSMFFASIAALMISTAPAYADDGTDNTNSVPAQQTPIVQVVDDPVDTPTTVTPQADDQQAGNQQADDQVAAPESLVVVDEAGTATAVEATQTKADGSDAVTGTDTTKADAGIYSITQNGSYTLTGSGYTAVEISGEDANDVQLTLVDATIDATGTGNSAISIVNGAKAILNIIGNCVLTGDVNQAGIQVDAKSEVTIKGEGINSASELTTIGNAGEQGTNTSGAGIGGRNGAGSSGKIIIDSLANLTAKGGGKHAAGIGSAAGGSASVITITNTNFKEIVGADSGSAEDGHFGKSDWEGGVGIGGGTAGGSAGDITIGGCTGGNIYGGSKAAAIGAGYWGHVGTISIIDSNLSNIVGGNYSAAIGTSRERGDFDRSCHIVIDNSTLSLQGGRQGAAIGSGYNQYSITSIVDEFNTSYHPNKGSDAALVRQSIEILNNSNIYAVGGDGAAGIGGGYKSHGVDVLIDSSSTVKAYAGGPLRESNGLQEKTEKTTESGAVGQSGAAGIGSGAFGSGSGFRSGALTIKDGAQVEAYSSGDLWAIDGFDTYNVDSMILQARFSRNYGSVAYYAPESNQGFLFLNANGGSELQVGNADGIMGVTMVDGARFDGGYSGKGNLGYYSFAATMQDAGTYFIKNTSAEADFDKGKELVLPGATGYQPYASYLADVTDSGTASADFTVDRSGISSFDMVAFRVGTDSTVPDPVPPTPPEPPVVPDTPVTPITPQVDPTPDPTPAPDPTPVPPAPVVVTPATVTPAPAAGAPAAPVAIVDAGVPLAPAAEAIADAEVPLAPAEEAIADDEAPLASGAEEDCWVHWWIMLGIMVTAAYSSVVMARRRRHSNNLKGMDKDIMDGNVRVDEPAANEAPASKPSVNLGPQPALSASTEA